MTDEATPTPATIAERLANHEHAHADPTVFDSPLKLFELDGVGERQWRIAETADAASIQAAIDDDADAGDYVVKLVSAERMAELAYNDEDGERTFAEQWQRLIDTCELKPGLFAADE